MFFKCCIISAYPDKRPNLCYMEQFCVVYMFSYTVYVCLSYNALLKCKELQRQEEGRIAAALLQLLGILMNINSYINTGFILSSFGKSAMIGRCY